jgi:PRC-barrel domain
MGTVAFERNEPASGPQDLAHKLIASDRVEGTPVFRADGIGRIGTIERLMIDKLSGQVAYAVMTFGGILGFGEKHFPIPWSALRYEARSGGYVTDITAEQLRNAPSHGADETFDWGDRSAEERLRNYYRYRGNWA